MDDKEKYLHAMKINKGRQDEITIGEILGYDETEIRLIISQLLSEYRIDYETEGRCSYSIR